MPLLVSVRSPEEVVAALKGGADIVDAKEPAHGPLGAVTLPVLSTIATCIPASVPLSVALGDGAGPTEVRAAVKVVRLLERDAPLYLKMGFAGVRSAERVRASLAAALGAVRLGKPPVIVGVAYADSTAAGTVAPEEVLTAAIAAGAGGLLVDTWLKDGSWLLDHLSLERLAELSAAATAAGLLFAAAGSLDADTLPRVAAVAEIVGVRGAACRGGRSGIVAADRVAALRQLLDRRPALSLIGG